jgi:hypothetical protein
MKEFDFDIPGLANGVSPKEKISKAKPELLECHNLEPIEENYQLHELVIDLNATGVTWSS